MRIRTWLVALLGLACCAAPAHAASGSFEVPVGPDSAIPKLAGPRPAGDAVAYAAGSADDGWSVRLGAPGVAATRELQAIGPMRGLTLGLDASATRIAVTQHAEYCTDCRYMSYVVTRDALGVAPLGGAPVDLVRCERGSCAEIGCATGRQRFTTALSGDLLAVLDACSGTARVVDLATGAARPLGPASAVAVAGRFVAVAQPGSPASDRTTIVVLDADSGAEVYRAGIPAAGVFGLSGPVIQLALRADGAVVYMAAGGGYALVVAAPSLPAGRVLRDALTATTILGLGADGALLFDGRSASLQRVALDGPSPAASQPIPDLVGTPAFDGATVAWARRTCATTTITSWRVGEPVPPPADLRCATPLSARGTVTLARDRRLPVALRCPATVRGGCSATVRLTAQRRGRVPRGVNGASRIYRLGRLEVRLNPGERRRVQVLVPSGAARWVRRHAPLRLRTEITSDVARAARRPAGDDGFAVRTATLRAAR